ncbi:MAG: hypothetical protein J0M29_10090 [Chitinophagales bacterium]|nr:hypothetical protein [Chitinophagales bacterium]
MENKDQNQTNINNSVNNYGINHGNMGHSITTSDAASKAGDLHPPSVEKAVWKGTVIKLVGEGRAEEALAEILKTSPPEDIRNQVVLLGGRLSQLKLERIAGILDKGIELKELSSIREGILLLISRC